MPAYSGLTDQQAAAVLNASIVTGTRPAALGDVKLILYEDAAPCAMLRIAAQTEVADTTLVGLQLAARTASAFLNDPHMEHIDFALASVQGMLALLVAGGVLRQALVNQVTALGQVTTTRAAQLRFPRAVTAADVHAARAAT